MNILARRAFALAILALLAFRSASAAPRPDDAYLPEDWTATYEPTHPSYWGVHWYYTNGLLPYRVLQRLKHTVETRVADNWRFGGETGGVPGVALRLVVGTMADFGLLMGGQNIHHAPGHDAAAREFNLAYGDRRSVPLRFKQVLPTYLGGRDLGERERQPNGRGADSNSRAMTLPMEAELTFAYEQGKELAASEEVNATSAQRFLFYRMRFLMDIQEVAILDQAFINSQQPGAGFAINDKKYSSDFTWYLHYLNRNRYGVTRVDDYKLKIGDVKTAIYLQLADPMMWTAAYAWGRDYLGHGRNRTRLPMLRLGERTSYMPSLRVFFSPFGIEYFQDNYLRHDGVMANAFWTIGDNRYEKRYGGGLDVRGIPLPRRAKLGAYAQLIRQPLLSRITDQTALAASEIGRGHIAYNVGGTIQIPVLTFAEGADPTRLFVQARAGTKNLSWFPGEYLGAGTYVETGLGLRF